MKREYVDKDRRRAKRQPVPAHSTLQASILAGPSVRMVNLSSSGALLRSNKRLEPGSGIRLRFALGEKKLTVHGCVLRSTVRALMKGAPVYECAVKFIGEVEISGAPWGGSMQGLVQQITDLMDRIEAEISQQNPEVDPGVLEMALAAPETSE